MRLYCNSCKSELVIGEGIDTRDVIKDGFRCPFYITHGEMEPIPDYETIEQYEQRTGKPYPDDWAVWSKFEDDYEDEDNIWDLDLYMHTKSLHCAQVIVTADRPMPPPHNWRPE